jgi:hypothetical protein
VPYGYQYLSINGYPRIIYIGAGISGKWIVSSRLIELKIIIIKPVAPKAIRINVNI